MSTKILITGGFLIPVRIKEFVWIGIGKFLDINYDVFRNLRM